jgi:hypothetical protein
MNYDTVSEHSSETHRIEAIYIALRSVGDMDTKSLRGESWFDDLYTNERGPEFDIQIDESWLDDLDEAA